jgi:chondroitin 4-sulfotransferase 11
MISDKHRFIFVHINRTGGTSIEKVFDHDADKRNVHRKHAPAAFYKRTFPERFGDYFKFAFVRNPWDWLVSRYHWSRDRQHLFDYSFHEMLWRLKNRVRLAESEPWLEERALLPQLDRLAIDGAVAVDFVGRFEDLQGDFDKVCARLRIEARTLQHVFATNHVPYIEHYDDETRRIVEQLYAADIAAFGYRFGDSLRLPRRTTGTWTQQPGVKVRPLELVPLPVAGAGTEPLVSPSETGTGRIEKHIRLNAPGPAGDAHSPTRASSASDSESS